ncbi:hypothetical protein [Paenibacillus sp.]|uniref:hypothetical protein n=1 Tax=Paenibacillus sp. TaxID=58172 RepID=UPI002810BC7A|nr:hypothetical protein [Paenibacillus sp.]
MNSRAINFIKNLSYSLVSNIISVIVSILIILIIPKLIGVQEYGYFQLYLFYTSYVGFLHLGWNDGIYLRYTGKDYLDLDKGLFFSQFYMLLFMQSFIALIIFTFSIVFFVDENKLFIYQMTALCLILTNVRQMLLYILQGTNKIVEYARIIVFERIIYCLIVFSLLFTGVTDYKLIIQADLVGKLISLFYAMYCCRDIVYKRVQKFSFSLTEILENIKSGISLMFANIASMLIIGVVRFGIERTWDVSAFGKVSLTLSISKLLMLLINSVGMVLFPVLRKVNGESLPRIYITLRDILMVFLFASLITYYPIKEILLVWLPKYTDSLFYMALMFPICVFEGKMALLISTYLKTLRKEKLILRVNLISLVLSLVLTLVTTEILHNLNLAIISMVILLCFRCIIAEAFLSRIIKIPFYKDAMLEIIMTTTFIIAGWYADSSISIIIYGFALVIYVCIKKKDLKNSIISLKRLTKT